ncbi:hypothetical protein [Nocardioides sp. CER19]|uniref:hypothetical protein n=1 Tax=Nocardioides sp. CER19 TaxID=3038538 RepID=UPI00244932A0|nr:hypothetical protein [Nocardioides sp. CER19]MDH2413350.1 hypothetical protein [Nocardioides sp. CER19]
MQNHPVEPTPCPDCGHLVYRPLMAPLRQPQQSCRAVVSGTGNDTDRCGCSNAVHRLPTMRPRHRLYAVTAG